MVRHQGPVAGQLLPPRPLSRPQGLGRAFSHRRATVLLRRRLGWHGRLLRPHGGAIGLVSVLLLCCIVGAIPFLVPRWWRRACKSRRACWARQAVQQD